MTHPSRWRTWGLAGLPTACHNPSTEGSAHSPFSFWRFSDGQASVEIRGHMAAFQFFGGVPRVVVPDNPKALVTKAERFDVTLNRTHLAFARHYGVAIVPPEFVARDKGHAEAGVPWVERWILVKLRHERLSEWDVARDRVATLLEAIPFRNSKDPASVSGSKNGPPWPPCRPLHSKTRRGTGRNKLAATALDRIAWLK